MSKPISIFALSAKYRATPSSFITQLQVESILTFTHDHGIVLFAAMKECQLVDNPFIFMLNPVFIELVCFPKPQILNPGTFSMYLIYAGVLIMSHHFFIVWTKKEPRRKVRNQRCKQDPVLVKDCRTEPNHKCSLKTIGHLRGE